MALTIADVADDFATIVDHDLVYGMTDALTVEVASYAKDEGGAQEPTWSTLASVQGRVQEYVREDGVENEAMRTLGRVRVWLPAGVDLDPNKRYRVKDAAGTRYSLVSFTPTDRIGRPVIAEAEVTPWPRS